MRNRSLKPIGAGATIAGAAISGFVAIYRSVLEQKLIPYYQITGDQAFRIVASLIIATLGMTAIGLFTWAIANRGADKEVVSGRQLLVPATIFVLVVAAILYILTRPAPPPPPPPPPGPNLISVQGAEYAGNWGAKSASILDYVRRECDNTQSCTIACDNDHAGGDPAKGTTKHCVVNYTCSHDPSNSRHEDSPESGLIVLVCQQ